MKTANTDLICDLTVLSTEERDELTAVMDSLFASVRESREQENGYSFRFLNQPGQLLQIARFIARESQCCPFLKFTLEVEPSSGPLWLRISGEAGTKEFLRAELAPFQNLERS